MNEDLEKAWEFLKGKKTYISAVIALAYGVLYKDPKAIIIGLVAFGLRNGIASEVADAITRLKKEE